MDEQTVLEHVPDELIAETYRARFVDLVRQHARELMAELRQVPEVGRSESGMEMAQRRAIRGASYRAFRQLWAERMREASQSPSSIDG